ncbi:MAG: hypothetical protein U0326_09315 [Polyangiales bacterium]
MRGVALIERFVGIVRECCVTHGAQPIVRCEAIERWLEDAHRCDIASVQTSQPVSNKTAMRFARP